MLNVPAPGNAWIPQGSEGSEGYMTSNDIQHITSIKTSYHLTELPQVSMIIKRYQELNGRRSASIKHSQGAETQPALTSCRKHTTVIMCICSPCSIMFYSMFYYVLLCSIVCSIMFYYVLLCSMQMSNWFKLTQLFNKSKAGLAGTRFG